MTLQELKIAISGKTFIDQNQIQHKFIPVDTLKVGGSHNNLVNYEIYETNNNFYLKHNNGLGVNEDLKISIISESQLLFTLTSKFSNKEIGTWTQQETNIV